MNMSYERVELFTWELQKRVPVQVKGETVLTGVHRGVTSRPGIRGSKVRQKHVALGHGPGSIACCRKYSYLDMKGLDSG